VLAIAAGAPLVALVISRSLRDAIVPIAVVELVLGAALGPHGLKLDHLDPTVSTLGRGGLGFLFFFAGYEIDFAKIRGTPLRLALIGWALSCVIAYAFAGVLAALGVVISGLLTGSAISTTAIGTILPALRDTNQLRGEFGRSILAAGGVGELGPVLIVTIVLSTQTDKVSQVIVLVAFVVITVLTALLASGAIGRTWTFMQQSLKTSSQLPVRLTVMLVLALLVIADSIGLDVILGAFAAGAIVRFALRGVETEVLESKLEAIGFGFLIPFFFIQSGMQLQLGALTNGLDAVLRVPLFLVGFLIVRGTPALLLYRRTLELRDRLGLALLSATQLPLVVAITELGISQGKMRQSTAVALVTAAVLSVLLFPTIAFAVRKPGTTIPPEASESELA
jgi:Kef-type K+ transport system membrane component KefB